MDNVIARIIDITKKYKSVTKVILFGSRARGDNTLKSDYDIAIRMIGSCDKNSLLDEIEHIDTLYKIDVVFIENTTGKSLIDNIKKDGVVVMDKFGIKLNNYEQALSRLHEAIDEFVQGSSLAVRDGVIQRFEFTAELAWKTIREYLLTLEIMDINNPKSVMKEAFKNDIIGEENNWIQILRDRNSTSHIYDEDQANEIYERIANNHVCLFDKLLSVLKNVIN